MVAVCTIARATDTNAQVLLAAYGGTMHTRPADVRLEQPARGTDVTFPTVPFRSESLDPPIYYGYRIAARIPRTQRFFLEAELIHAKIFAQASQPSPFTSAFDRFGISHGMNFVLLNLLVRKPLADNGRWIATARAGVGPMVPHPEIVIADAGDDQDGGYQLGGIGAQLAGGLERQIVSRLSVFAEYKFTSSRLEMSVDAANVRLTARSHHLAFGVGFAFN